LGAQSTRPHSELITEEEELSRLSGIIEKITNSFPQLIISIDTFYSRVAKESIISGASIINDISGGNMDDKMFDTASSLKVPYVCMHMRGTPQTMHQFTDYDDITVSLLDYFIRKIEECKVVGINDVIVDPGFGFSKTITQNFQLLKKLNTLKILGKPILVGLSRKSTVYKTLGITSAESLNGTTVLNTAALIKGADILRVHDVKEAKQCIALVHQLM
ncbi:MAG: dihydropteroate synthase, partial [Flavitalea sp.]